MTLAAAMTMVVLSAAAPATATANEVNDPFEGFNRAMFKFNDGLDRWILEPVAKGWDFVVPEQGQTAVRNIFANALFPVDFTNELLQWKPKGAAVSLGRFVLNSTLGVGGIFDHGDTMGLEENHEDFGQTFAVWGIGDGPYLMLPFFGPSNPRDGIGMLFDSAARVWPYYVEDEVIWGVAAVGVINFRAGLIDEIETARETSLDYYSFVRNLYAQRRAAAIENRDVDDAAGDDSAASDDADDLYYYDENYDEDSE